MRRFVVKHLKQAIEHHTSWTILHDLSGFTVHLLPYFIYLYSPLNVLLVYFTGLTLQLIY